MSKKEKRIKDLTDGIENSDKAETTDKNEINIHGKDTNCEIAENNETCGENTGVNGTSKKRLGKKKKVLISILSVIVAIALIIGGFNVYFAVIGKQIQVGQASGYEWSSSDAFSKEHIGKIEMGVGDFKILLLTDVHLKNSGTFGAWFGVNYILDWAGETALNKLVKNVDPDLIILTGDTALTQRNDIEYSRFVKQMDGYKTPWAAVFGNHDDEGRADKAKLADELLKSEYGLFKFGPSDMHGAGNYAVELTRDEKTEYVLFCMDSGSSREFTNKTEGINGKQVDWYEWNVKGYETELGEKPKNMAFFHIPVPVYSGLKTFEKGGRGENSCPENSNNAILDSMLANNGSHIFVGHDHNNNFIAEYNGIKLGYVTKSSYNCYYEKGKTGGTLLTINADNQVKEEIVSF